MISREIKKELRQVEGESVIEGDEERDGEGRRVRRKLKERKSGGRQVWRENDIVGDREMKGDMCREVEGDKRGREEGGE